MFIEKAEISETRNRPPYAKNIDEGGENHKDDLLDFPEQDVVVIKLPAKSLDKVLHACSICGAKGPGY